MLADGKDAVGDAKYERSRPELTCPQDRCQL
jgi:hypothetical protein